MRVGQQLETFLQIVPLLVRLGCRQQFLEPNFQAQIVQKRILGQRAENGHFVFQIVDQVVEIDVARHVATARVFQRVDQLVVAVAPEIYSRKNIEILWLTVV